MFFFGDAEQTARLYIDNKLGQTGPVIPDVHYEEMEEQDLRYVFAYLYGAVKEAHRDGADAEVIAILTRDYDAVFKQLAEVSERFRDVVARGRHIYIPNRKRENVEKYKKLAGLI